MLAAWFRMKYPHVIQGSLAASAPVLFFPGAAGIDQYGFGKIVSDDFNMTGAERDPCWQGMKDGFLKLYNTPPTPALLEAVNYNFKICDGVKIENNDQLNNLAALLTNGFFYMAMLDYPQEASFLEPMPANPVNVSCQAFDFWTPSNTDN